MLNARPVCLDRWRRATRSRAESGTARLGLATVSGSSAGATTAWALLAVGDVVAPVALRAPFGTVTTPGGQPPLVAADAEGRPPMCEGRRKWPSLIPKNDPDLLGVGAFSGDFDKALAAKLVTGGRRSSPQPSSPSPVFQRDSLAFGRTIAALVVSAR
ncbi:MAG: hypothetical protein R3C00_09535 [Hyphomonas sp.]